MARPVKITNIGTRIHAQKLKRALRRTYPAWAITIGQQEDGRLTLSATPPAEHRGRSKPLLANRSVNEQLGEGAL